MSTTMVLSDFKPSEGVEAHKPSLPLNNSTIEMADYIKKIESRFDELEKKYSNLLSKDNNKPETEARTESAEDKTEGKRNKPNAAAKKRTVSDAGPSCTPELNRLSWVQWRKLKVAEEMWKKKTDTQQEKEIEKGRQEKEKFAIDVVSDVGDPVLSSSTDKLGVSKRHLVPCRIRINSEHILDALNEITDLFLPQPCQLLHPFKIIVDHVDDIREYMKTLERNLEESKVANDAKLLSKSNVGEEHKKNPSNESGKDTQKTVKTRINNVERAEEKCKHYRCLLELLDNDLSSELEIAKSIKEGKIEKIMFSHLWHLFPPGETIYYQDPNRSEPPQASMVLQVSGGRSRLPNGPKDYFWRWQSKKTFQSKFSAFTIDSFYLDFDGKRFRLVQTQYEIPRYNGEMPISSLKVYPLRFLPKSTEKETMKMLLDRGRNFVELTTEAAPHREYLGMTLDTERETIDGRVVVDFQFCPPVTMSDSNQHSKEGDKGEKGRVFGLKPTAQTDDGEVTEVIPPDNEPETSLYNDYTYDCDKSDKLFNKNRILIRHSQEMDAEDLTEDELRVLPGSVYAYVLRNRRYCKCDITKIKKIQPNKKAFNDLVLPKTHRTLIKSLVERHSRGSALNTHGANENLLSPIAETPTQHSPGTTYESKRSNQHLSIVKGKGKGLIILLHGVPGVGKTSTAETIAEATDRPLLPITCGDIGENAAEVEKNLEKVFTNSHRWGCVLLLDEAEVFLAKRSNEDLKRNAMVSVFLRVLEYYSGILFLTTNRVGTIDEAFKSRIHISLYYPPLSWPTSEKIWKGNMERCQEKVRVNEKAIIKYAKKHFEKSDKNSRWNGRQIYNAFKTAIALAQFESSLNKDKTNAVPEPELKLELKPELKPEHFEQVAKVSKRFEKYLLDTQGGTSMASWNKERNIRADDFGMVEDEPSPLKRTPTRNRMFDSDELPSDSDSDDSDDDNSEQDSPSGSEQGSDSDEGRKRTRKTKSSKSGKYKNANEKKKKKRKSKKSKAAETDDSDESS